MKQNKKKRFRQQQQFWLDLNKPEEAVLSEKIAELKADREFVSTVRQGIMLVMALRQGDLSLLDELFPQAVDEIFQAGVDSVESQVDSSLVEKKLTALANMVESLSSVSAGDSGPKPLLVSGSLGTLAGSGKPLPGPDSHNDLADLLEVKDASTEHGSDATQNLINSMLRSQKIKSDKPARPSKMVKGNRQPLEELIEVKEGR